MAAHRNVVVPALVAGATVLLSIATPALAAANGGGLARFLAENQANTWIAGLTIGLVGALVLRARPGNRLGPIFATAGLLAATSAAAAQYATYSLEWTPEALPATNFVAWCASILWLPAFLTVLGAVPLLFPDGRLASPRWRYPARIAAIAGALATVSLATTQAVVDDGFEGATNPFDLPWPDDAQVVIATTGFFAVLAVGVAANVAIIVRMRRAGEPGRAQSAWYVTSVTLALLGSILPLGDALGFLMNALSVAALGIGIVRYRLFDIETVLSRTVVYTLLTAGAMTAYFLAAAAFGAGFDTGVGPALIAAVVALGLAGLRHRAQRGVDRLLYGERTDPLAALTTLGDRLGNALDADAVLPAVVETVRHTLRVPYAALRLAGDDSPACASGQPPPATVDFALAHAGQEVGTLVVGLRRGESTLAVADARILEAFAKQVGVAAHGVRVTRDLRRSRERIVSAREEERRRIRRDLHDGIGPTLAGISLGLETAGRTATREGSRNAELLASIRHDASACVEEIRRIVADLRPPALDEVGLLAALTRHVELLNSRSQGQFEVAIIDRPVALPPLPAAVEVAVYRIAMEAITNAARHAGATRCTVSITVGGELTLVVQDDGSGRSPRLPHQQGVGLASMRERAEELGGTCVVTFREGVGTTVAAALPVATVAAS